MDIFIKDGWKTPDTYTNSYSQLPKKSGVYIFLRRDIDQKKEDKILYVGMSISISKRIESHNIIPLIKDFFQIWFKEYPKEQIREIERELIKKYNPPFNIIGRERGV